MRHSRRTEKLTIHVPACDFPQRGSVLVCEIQKGNYMALREEFLTLIRQQAIQQAIAPEKFLFQQGDMLQSVFWLESGLVKMTHTESDGQENILDLRFAGSLLGVTSILAHEPAPMTAVTVMPCKVYRFPAHNFFAFTNNNADFTQALMKYVSQQRNEQLNLRAQQNILDARSRLLILLTRLAKVFGIERNGQIYLALPITKQDMAGMLGITPQRLSNIFRKLKIEGAIVEENEWIIIQELQALRRKSAIAKESYSWQEGEQNMNFERYLI